jgi:hypothetical protein
MMVDLIVENGRIHTGDPEAPVVGAVAVLAWGGRAVRWAAGVGRGLRLQPCPAARGVLEEHPADVAVAEIGSIPVLATAVGGVFTHRQSGW